MAIAISKPSRRRIDEASNIALERTAGSHSLTPAAHRGRWTDPAIDQGLANWLYSRYENSGVGSRRCLREG